MYDILTDPEKQMSVLIEPETGRALGPVASGENAEQVLEAFVGALGVDPAILQHWEIAFRFNQYLEALIGDVEPDQPPPPAPEPDPTTAGAPSSGSSDVAPAGADPASGMAGGAGESVVPSEGVVDSSSTFDTTSTPAIGDQVNVADAAAGAPTDEPPAPAAADTDPTVAPGGGDSSPATTSAGGSDAPVGVDPVRPSVPENMVTCPACDGWGTVAENGQVVNCRPCGGTGNVTSDVAEALRAEQPAG